MFYRGGIALSKQFLPYFCFLKAIFMVKDTETEIAAAKRIGNGIKRLRENLGLSQPQFARELGLKSHFNLCRIERGTHLPSVKTLCLIEEKYGVKWGFL
jgi:DNA-binding transcriptional regulator YiaG